MEKTDAVLKQITDRIDRGTATSGDIAMQSKLIAAQTNVINETLTLLGSKSALPAGSDTEKLATQLIQSAQSLQTMMPNQTARITFTSQIKATAEAGRNSALTQQVNASFH